MGILETSGQLRRGDISPVDLARECLSRIGRLNPVLNAFITVTAESALAEAVRAEAEIRSGHWRGPLHGIPIALKDLIDTAGVLTTAASALFKDRVPAEDAEIVHRLRQAGAVFLGKHNLHEFAYGGSSFISHFGPVRNPWHQEYIAGGSSGGSAAAVAAGLCHAGLGTDTAGSIREPASICGVVGFKPTYGRVSARGVIPLSPSLDHVGHIAKSVTDAAIVLQAIAGNDPADLASANVPLRDYVAALSANARSLRVGVPRVFFYEGLHPEVSASVEVALAKIRGMVAEVRALSLEVNADRSLQAAESYAYHAEFVAKSPELYQPETLRRIRTGERISEADRVRYKAELDQERRAIASTFGDLDLVVTPTIPVPPPTLAELREKPETLREKELLLLRNTRPFNVWGLPTISVPCGFTQAGLPVGLQIAGPPWREDLVLSLAHAYEQATGWHTRTPPLFE